MSGEAKLSAPVSGCHGTEAGAPRHVAIIMDGNGRWAAQRGLPRFEGHRRGVDAIRRAVRAAGDLGIRYLTVYSFSAENWRRPAQEVADLMGLLKRFVRHDLAELHASNIRVRVIGERRADETSPYGARGNSIVRYHGETYDDIVLVGGFSKAYSSLLAFIAVPTDLKNLIKVAAPTYLFSGPSPVASLASVLAGMDVNEDRGDRYRFDLHRMTRRLLDHIHKIGIVTLNTDETPIVELPIAAGQDFTVLVVVRKPIEEYRDIRVKGTLIRRELVDDPIGKTKVVFVDRFNRVDWPVQMARITAGLERYGNPMVWVDSTGVGDPITDAMVEHGLRPQPYKFTAASKAALINGLALLLEQRLRLEVALDQAGVLPGRLAQRSREHHFGQRVHALGHGRELLPGGGRRPEAGHHLVGDAAKEQLALTAGVLRREGGPLRILPVRPAHVAVRVREVTVERYAVEDLQFTHDVQPFLSGPQTFDSASPLDVFSFLA